MAIQSLARPEIQVRGDVKCYHCGYISGELVGGSAVPLGARRFTPSPGLKEGALFDGDRLACLRCGGPVYLDDMEVVRERVFKCVIDPYETRPGRRPGSKSRKPSTAVGRA